MRTATLVLAAGLAIVSDGTRADDPPEGWVFVGQTQPAAAIDVRARVTGQLTRVAVREGDAVKKGDLLAEIDPRISQLDVDAAKARLLAAQARLEAAKLKAENAKRLLENKVVSQLDVGLSMAAQAEAEAAVMVAKADVERAELILSWTRVMAPFDGRVSRLPSAEGSLVIADQTHILTVAAADPLTVTFNVSENRLLQLRRDGLTEPDQMSVTVGFAGDEGFPHAAKLDLIATEADPRTATVRFRATVPNPQGLLLPGMSARVRLTLRK